MNLAFTCKYLIINDLGFGFDFWTEMKKAPVTALGREDHCQSVYHNSKKSQGGLAEFSTSRPGLEKQRARIEVIRARCI
jgi:hypothetical protein